MSRAPPAWPRPDGAGGASAPTSRSPSGPPSRIGARPQRARVRPPSSAPPWGRSTGHRRTAPSKAARATAPEARGAARSVRCRCADASHPGPRARVRCSGRVTARSSAGQSSSPPRHPRSCDPGLTTISPERASSRSDPGPTGASLRDPRRADDQQPAPWLASAPHGAPAYPLFNNPGILNPSPSPGARMTRSACCATRFCHEPTRASLGQRSGMPSLCLSYDEDQMTTRNDTNDQTKAADEAARTARTVTDEAARVGEQTARASADLARRSTETARETFQAGLDTANETFRRMTDQVNQVLGFNGPQAEKLTRQVSQNLQAVSQASTVLARGAQEVSHEVFGLVQDRAQQNVDAVNRIVKTRSVQDL